MKWQRVATVGLVAVLVVVLGGCGFFTKTGLESEDQSERLQPQSVGQVGKTVDDLFAEVARRVPEFGGMFLSDDEATLQVYLTDLRPPVVAAARAAIAAVFGAQRIPRGGIQGIQGQYSFLQLKRWYNRMWVVVLGLPGVTMTDIDDAKNRLTIGLERMEVADQLKQTLAQLGIPLEVVNFEETGPVEFLNHTLRDPIRPVVGGIQIRSEKTCSISFNAIRMGVNGFVTASHCTNIQGGVESTVFYQPTIIDSNRIGVETVDPLYQTGGGCPSGRRCRWSDSAFARYDSGVSFNRGYIARTTRLGSITIDSTSPTFRIVAKADGITLNDTLNKVGRTTGWTQGPVDGVCRNVNVGGSNVTLLCQHRVRANAEGMDSGSTVFKITNSPNTGDVTLYGILWGGTGSGWPWDPRRFWFSHITFDVEFELGSLTTCAPGFSC